MKRRKISSDSSEKRPKPSSDEASNYHTPKRAASTRPRFVTPFKTPLNTCKHESGSFDSPTSPVEKENCSEAEKVRKSEQSESSSVSLGHTSTPKSRVETPRSKTVLRRFNTPLKVLQHIDTPQSPMQTFLKKKKLQKELNDKESLLRKFKQYSRAKETGEIEKLESLVKQWRGVSQEVLLEMLKHGKNNEPSLSLGSVIQRLRVNPVLVNFDVENDDFTE